MIRPQDLFYKIGTAALLLFVWQTSALSAQAQQVGSYVVVVEEADILSGTTKVEHVSRGMALKVRGSRPGGWLWVTRHANGWIQAKHVVTLPTAMNYLAAEISQQPQQAPLYNDRAMVHFETGNYAGAVKDYSTAISLAPGSIALRANRAVAYFELGDFESAVRDLDEVVRRLPDDAQSYVDRGWALYHAGRYKEALADFEQALELNPESNQAKINLAWLQATCPDESFRDGKAALKTAENVWETMERQDPFALAVLAAAQAELGQHEKAVESQTEAVELAPYTRKKLYKDRLAFYEAEQPYRLGETTPQPKPKTVAKAEPEEAKESEDDDASASQEDKVVEEKQEAVAEDPVVTDETKEVDKEEEKETKDVEEEKQDQADKKEDSK